ncbi:MAG: hypothetical protein ABSB11_01550 [Sedimentisphaerales bacterium]|jgi:hydrogenase maturation factor HypF (carbamoyltransferase family)
MNISEIVTLVLSTFGGTCIIVGGLSVWLGKIWAKRIAESERHAHAKEIELLKAQLDNEQCRNNRAEDARFKRYNEVWEHLQEVEEHGEELWNNASRDNWETFLTSLRNARLAMNKGRLILAENHYRQLCQIMDEFDYYAKGKAELIELRSLESRDSAFNEFLVRQKDIRQQIWANAHHRRRYQQLLDEIAEEFKRQLKI